ncbi:hypothetical protein L6452_14423 [Arctium lappa]|uniref:Uncharacterized protein n=1 Tax=Arctium lappa TaxID=4217 RepID=A0ACB9CL08_ARCLA|nr:hypothetical protein L6452_14423 [Arctium lappa]
MATAAHHHHHHHHRLLQKPIDLEITIVSAKHLKNVNWRNGDLNPYTIFWVDPNRRLATKSDDSNSTKPVWNERFVVPLPATPFAAILTLEIFHSKPSDTPKPLVGTLRLPLGDLPDPQNSNRIRTFEVRRPSGRLNGKIRLKLALRERALPDYSQNTPQPPFYYASPPPPSYGRLPSSPSPTAAPPYHNVSHSDPYSVYYQGGYYSQPPPPSIDRQLSYGSVVGGPSAPMDYDQKGRNGKVGSGSGLGFGANTRGVAGLAIDEGLRYEDGKIGERVENDIGVTKKPDEYRDVERVPKSTFFMQAHILSSVAYDSLICLEKFGSNSGRIVNVNQDIISFKIRSSFKKEKFGSIQWFITSSYSYAFCACWLARAWETFEIEPHVTLPQNEISLRFVLRLL